MPLPRPRRRTVVALAAVVLAVVAATVVIVVVTIRSSPRTPTPSRFAAAARVNTTCGRPVTTASSAAQHVRRSGTQLTAAGQPWRFTGVNEFWLGLDGDHRDASGPTYPTHAAIDQGIGAASKLCARMIRSISLGVSVGNPRSIEPQLGKFNDAAFDRIDYAVAVARLYGIRLVIPFTDAYHYYTGGQHTFTNWLGHSDLPGQTQSSNGTQRYREAQFFTDAKVIAAFHAYLRHYLTHKNKYTGIELGQDPTIAMWELGNELNDVPSSWAEQTARYVKSLSPDTLVAFNGSTQDDFADAARAQPAIDAYDGHFYPPDADAAGSQAAATRKLGRVYFVGEYPMYARTIETWLARLADDTDVAGDLAWSLLPVVDGTPQVHADGYTFHDPPSGADEQLAVSRLLAHARRVLATP